jgi:hypothetical protein
MQRIPQPATTTQTASRRSHGIATANSMTPHTSMSHANQSTAATREGINSIREQSTAQGSVSGVGWDIARQQISCDVGIGQLEKLRERRAFFARGMRMMIAQVSQQQEIEFLHSAPAAPLQAPFFNAGVQSSSS